MVPSENTCPREESNAEITESERVACVDGEYPETATVGRYAATCANGHLTVEDVPESLCGPLPGDRRLPPGSPGRHASLGS